MAALIVRQFGPTVRQSLESQHGRPIPFAVLAPCARPIFVPTSYGPVEGALPAFFRNAVRGHWFVRFCDGAAPTVRVLLAADAALEERDGGVVIQGRYPGNEFLLFGIPATGDDPYVDAVAAITAAHGLTGRRVAAPPRLHGDIYAIYGVPTVPRPLGVLWEVPLDAAVVGTVDPSGDRVSVAAVWLVLGYSILATTPLYIADTNSYPSIAVPITLPNPPAPDSSLSVTVRFVSPVIFSRFNPAPSTR